MKVLLIVPEYPPHHIGGGGAVFKELVRGYTELGHRVCVIYGYYKSGWFDKLNQYNVDGVDFYQIPEIPYPRKFPFLRTVMPILPSNMWRLKEIIKNENPDVAHLHGYGLSFIWQAALICKSLKLPYMFSLHGYPATQEGKNFLVKFIYSIYENLFRFVTENASLITGVSNFITMDRRLDKYSSKRVTIMNGINADEYKTFESIDLADMLNLDKDSKPVFIFSMGRLAYMKGFQEMISLLPDLVKQTGKNLHYIVAGEDDGYKEDLCKKVDELALQGRVHFIGLKNRQEIINLLNSCDVFSIPSIWDPCPIAAYEGMAVNKICITTDAGGIIDIYKDYPHKYNIYTQYGDIIDVIKNEKYINLDPVDISHLAWIFVSKKYIDYLNIIK